MKTACKSFQAALRSASVLSGGQDLSDQILQLAHRIEKGLTIASPKAMWGWKKAWELAGLLEKADKDSFAYQTGGGVLYAYLAAKKQTGDPQELSEAEKLELSLTEKNMPLCDNGAGGAIAIQKEQIRLSEAEMSAVEKLFFTRHSVRDFDNTDVSEEAIMQAVQWASRCPSACNRQPFRMYVVGAADRKNLGFENELSADKYVLITGRISAYKTTEFNDWIVSATIFAAYLSLALHAYGIGSCVMRKDLIKETQYNVAMRRFCGIPQNEQIVLELAVGNYKENFTVPVSNRMPAEELVSFVGGKD